MNHFNIEWHQFQESGGPETWYADILGYHMAIFPHPSRESGGTSRFTATYEVFGERWHVGPAEGFASVEDAKHALDALLAQAVQDLRVGSNQTALPQGATPPARSEILPLLVEKGLVTVKNGILRSTPALREILTEKGDIA